MATLATPLPVEPSGRLFTAADLAAMPNHLPSGDVNFELDKGRLIVMAPPGHTHAGIQFFLASALYAQGQSAGHGRGFTHVGVVLSRKPDTILGSDLAFITAGNLPVRESPEGYLETIPDLVIEIRSRNDTIPELETKVGAYLAAKVRIVWVVDPVAKTICVYRPDGRIDLYNEADTATLDDLFPGFRLSLAEVFQG